MAGEAIGGAKGRMDWVLHCGQMSSAAQLLQVLEVFFFLGGRCGMDFVRFCVNRLAYFLQKGPKNAKSKKNGQVHCF